MTNYNERRDEIFKTLNNKAREVRASCTERNNWEGYNPAYERLEDEAKQAITSLTKEMVAEAKPGKYSSGESILNVDGIGEVDGYEGYNQAIDQFEQNLLKALEEK